VGEEVQEEEVFQEEEEVQEVGVEASEEVVEEAEAVEASEVEASEVEEALSIQAHLPPLSRLACLCTLVRAKCYANRLMIRSLISMLRFTSKTNSKLERSKKFLDLLMKCILR